MNFQTTYISQKKKNPFIRLVKLIVWIFLILWIIFYTQYSSFQEEIITDKEHIIEIQPWDTFIQVLWEIWANQTFSKIHLKQNPPSFNLQTGRYKVHWWANIDEIIEALQTPIYDEINLTILEGWNIYDTDEYLEAKGLIQEWEYINYATSKEKIEALTEFFPFLEDVITLEGYLYPDTYTTSISPFKINNFVISQLDAFEQKVYKPLLSEKQLSYTQIHNLINLASIVEKEERNPNEKSTVAGILKKRLQEWWMIWADITVCYPHKLTSQECKMVVSKYINEKSEYNTRTMVWLPKTPIGNPSYQTIDATLNHKITPYYFYLHNTTTGKIYYAETNAQHERNKVLYMK